MVAVFLAIADDQKRLFVHINSVVRRSIPKDDDKPGFSSKEERGLSIGK
jgi:hypothetical protein